jgi:hypothetical protein
MKVTMRQKKLAGAAFLAVAMVGLVGIIRYRFAQPDFYSAENKSFYLVGQMLARKADSLQLSEREVELVLRGFRDWSVKRKSEITYENHVGAVERLYEQRIALAASEEKQKEQSYLQRFISEGAKTTGSGLAYKIVSPGSSLHPKESDLVEVRYHGVFPDGKVFDSNWNSKDRSQFPLNHVIPGWTEGLQLVGEGGEIDLLIPSSLAYGDQGSPPAIPPGASLRFKVKLIKVVGKRS